MKQRPLGNTGFQVAPIIFGGNVFGWTVDEKRSFALLDAWVDAGFNAIDTADMYSSWVEGNKGGESETIIGHWLQAHPSKRDKVLIFTKVGGDFGDDKRKGLKAGYIRLAVEASLKRLSIETIDLYQSHFPDETVDDEETLSVYQDLIKEGKVRAIGASNYSATQLDRALKIAADKNLPAYQTLQPEYNLYDRNGYEGGLSDLCVAHNIGVIPYYSLASGFLSGKYRSEADLGQSKRGEGIKKYLNNRGMRILAALDEVSKRQNAKPAEIALAWLLTRPAITAPIASATSIEQMNSLKKATEINLTQEDVILLNDASSILPTD
ncbi:MAG: aldo/keto reductase [Zymomonas mobilis]|uniref:Aryl-alcohol dehydrogenase-like predicted oxidoreductase n=1 Tax=Zymomonas mobilis TaxID=542 RepID=A0A542VZ57_ZYMMB|nr:aldo/keto reductase [Zymomonas mobilis]TQL16612.1 aryl-alcohol dehydrogenase-like predicted oxidoreductase [Zymomonas mobilis]